MPEKGNADSPEQWRKALVRIGATIQDCIRCLDDSTLQIVLVEDDNGVFLGTLTDGDIRRGLLRGLGLGSPIESVVHRGSLVVPPEVSRDTALQIMQANKVRQIPIVDGERRVLGLHVWDDLFRSKRRTNPMIVMAGGQGTRLRPYTETCPKPLLPVNGKPMLEHIVERARAEGFEDFIFAVHYLGRMIEDYFGAGEKWNVCIRYLREESPMGTAGALSLLDPIPEGPFLVSNGDVLTDIRYGDLVDFHTRNGAAATMAVRMHEWQHPFGVVHTRGIDIVGFEEKPVSRTHVNAGIYVLNPESISQLEAGSPCDMPTLFSRLQAAGERAIVYPMHEPWLDVGRPDDYRLAQEEGGRRGS